LKLSTNKKYLSLSILILIGILLRIYFFVGHIFSDDAYYAFLSQNLFSEDFSSTYLGYPIFTLRIGHLFLTNLSMTVFGSSEFSTIVFPFLFSITNLFLTYKIAYEYIQNEKTALISTFFMAFFPTDVIFASINFVDLQNVFFINIGIYLLLKAGKQESFKLSVLAGIFFSISFLFKENFYYHWILLIVLWLFLLIKNKEFNLKILTSILIVVFFLTLEGTLYLLLCNDFIYRLSIMQQNYNFSYYDFFPYTAQKLSGSKNYLRNLFDQIFLINGRALFLRRFYLFLPLMSLVQCIINIKKKENLLLTFWFIGLAVLMIAFTTSFTEFKPLDLKRSWYIYPLIMPMVLLSALLLNRLKIQFKYFLLIAYVTGSFIMCDHYREFFNTGENNKFKNFLKSTSNKIIYTDHFTKYSIDLIRGNETFNKSGRILDKDFNWEKVAINDLVIYSEANVDELKLQKYEFPDFQILFSEIFKELNRFGKFRIFERKR
jgi:4-amino-4-deoxy-L-arabinose transferase-like glycosyltransferase